MKPLISETQDIDALQEIGRVSVQIVHDLKNQLNGLKLYATFLRKRMEKSERPPDEQETIGKLISGLERAAADMTTLVRFGRPLELRRQPRVDLVKILTNIATSSDLGPTQVRFEAALESLEGEFDTASLAEALKTVTTGAISLRSAEEKGAALLVHLRREETAGAAGEGAAAGPSAIIEWRGLRLLDGVDPFHSFIGSGGLRMSLAARIIAAHGGEASPAEGLLRVRLPIKSSDK
jgi:light-regulated signal transduction histidine kinase (bacteriophytochrome)